MIITVLVVTATAVSGKASIFESLFGKKNPSDFLGGIFNNVQKLIAAFKKSKGVKPTDPLSPVASKPKFCKNRECPSFTVKNRTDVYELRCYEAAKWVSTKANGYRKYFFKGRNFQRSYIIFWTLESLIYMLLRSSLY